MTGKKNNLDKLSHNYKELDDQGRETLLKIGEKVFTVNNFVNREISSLISKNNKEEKFESE
ncbi:MAG: hypothetical protein LBR93_09705 [Treponema sp.]|jgi:hypothetical protein|nr:hypothetical protein [Treponema sp.]